MTLIDKTKNYLNVEENNFYTFKHFNFEDVKEAVLDFKLLLEISLDPSIGIDPDLIPLDKERKNKLRKICKKYNLDFEWMLYNEYDIEEVFLDIFGDFEK
jgi:hypothetical protein